MTFITLSPPAVVFVLMVFIVYLASTDHLQHLD